MVQPSLFSDSEHLLRPPPPSALPNEDEVRGKLARVLDQLRRAETAPWGERELQYWRTVFPQMSNWLPPEERSEVVAAFQSEMARLDGA